MADITMPQLGETVTEGTITRWMKNVGDKVEEDEVLYEVSTDKVDSEVPSPVSGYISEIIVPEGETADVGARLAVISDAPPSGDGAAAAPPVSDTAEPAAAQEQAADAAPTAAQPEPTPAQPEPAAEPEPAAAPEPQPEPTPARAGAGTRPADTRPDG